MILYWGFFVDKQTLIWLFFFVDEQGYILFYQILAWGNNILENTTQSNITA